MLAAKGEWAALNPVAREWGCIVRSVAEGSSCAKPGGAHLSLVGCRPARLLALPSARFACPNARRPSPPRFSTFADCLRRQLFAVGGQTCRVGYFTAAAPLGCETMGGEL